MRVRRYQPDDFSQIMDICRAESSSEKPNETEYRTYLSRPDKEHYVVLDGDNAIALVSITEVEQGLEKGLYFFSQVKPSYYGSGVGWVFYRFLLEYLRELSVLGQEIHFLQASCDTKRQELLDFLLALGGEVRHYFQTMYMDVENCRIQPQIPDGFRVSTLTEDNLEEYYELEKQVFKGYFTYNPKSLGHLRKLAMSTDFQWDGAFLLRNELDEMIGFCRTQFNKSSGTITHLGVKEEYRHRGLGRNMLLYGIEALQQKGAKRIMLAVDGANEYAFNLYKRLGFLTRTRRLILEKRVTPEMFLHKLEQMKVNV